MFRSSLVGASLIATATVFGAAPAETLINYGQLGHAIRLSELRAGNHDDSGVNDYYFEVKVFGLIASQEEKKLEMKERKKIPVDGGQFGSIQITALSHWEKTEPRPEINISGETVRDLVARTMKQFSVGEAEVAVLIEVEMLERNKRYMFFGEDRSIGKTSYYLIPETFPHRPATKDLKLSITDTLGTAVGLEVAFKINNAEGDAAAAAAAAVGG